MRRSIYVILCTSLLLVGCGTSTVAPPVVVDAESQVEAETPTPNESAESAEPATEDFTESTADSGEDNAALTASNSTSLTAEPSPQEQFEAIETEYDEAYSDFYKAYRAADNAEAQREAMAMRPNGDDFAARLLELANEHPQTEAAVDALVWVNSNSRGAAGAEARQALLTDYRSNAKVAPVVMMMSYSPTADTEEQLKGLIDSDSETLQAAAKYALGTILIGKDHESEEALGLLQSVVKDHADVEIAFGSRKMKLAPRAVGQLTEATQLQIGMVAPEIEGPDLDGVDFKLSDYRGKVVVLDFWGNW